MSVDSENQSFAAVDVGSHTLRLLIARLEKGTDLRPLQCRREVCRLAQGFQERGLLQPAPMRRSLEVLAEYARQLRDVGVDQVQCGATGVFRRAANAADFLQRVRAATGLVVPVLSEQEEAELSAAGMASVLPPSESVRICFDLGGSTTELAVLAPGERFPRFTESVFIGAATVTERFFPDAPAPAEALRAAADYCGEQLRAAAGRALAAAADAACGAGEVVGSAGTVTTLAAMRLRLERYDPRRINGLDLNRKWLETVILRLAALPPARRLDWAGLEAGREDIILGGAVIVRELLTLLGRNRFLAADAGLLEGLLLAAVGRRRTGSSRPVGPLTWRWQSG